MIATGLILSVVSVVGPPPWVPRPPALCDAAMLMEIVRSHLSDHPRRRPRLGRARAEPCSAPRNDLKAYGDGSGSGGARRRAAAPPIGRATILDTLLRETEAVHGPAATGVSLPPPLKFADGRPRLGPLAPATALSVAKFVGGLARLGPRCAQQPIVGACWRSSEAVRASTLPMARLRRTAMGLRAPTASRLRGGSRQKFEGEAIRLGTVRRWSVCDRRSSTCSPPRCPPRSPLPRAAVAIRRRRRRCPPRLPRPACPRLPRDLLAADADRRRGHPNRHRGTALLSSVA